MDMLKKHALILLLVLTFTRCDNNDDAPPITPTVLLEANLFKTVAVSDIKSFIASTGLPLPSAQIKYDVDIYKITYETIYKDNTITASGLVALPKTTDPVAMLSFQHGTISAHADAPSEASDSDDILDFYSAMASVGFVGVIPDLIGFGASKNVVHPYYVEGPTATAVMDNIRAARELALTKQNRLSKRLFLAGYSQGGYATLATHKAIEEQNGLEDLTLIASFPSSGGYDVKGMQQYFFNLTNYDQPFYIAFVAVAYKTYYQWDQPLNLMFKEPYASKIPALFDGSKSGSQVNNELTEDISDLLQPEILVEINTDVKYKFLVDAFNENSLTDWTPKTPVYFYHGTSDITVPYQNSVDTYNTLIQNGASTSIVTLTPLPFATHGTGITPYIIELTNKLLAFK
jgi:pimeloyl-ACP methyl ester carboxylesterase